VREQAKYCIILVKPVTEICTELCGVMHTIESMEAIWMVRNNRHTDAKCDKMPEKPFRAQRRHGTAKRRLKHMEMARKKDKH
jgi:hypothetical protein